MATDRRQQIRLSLDDAHSQISGTCQGDAQSGSPALRSASPYCDTDSSWRKRNIAACAGSRKSARITRAPGAALDLDNEALDQMVEQSRFL